MPEQKRRLVERILDPGYLEVLRDKPLEDLRSMRDECREAETEISFERRLAQARIDILSAELDRRAGGGDEDLMSKLPQILATEARAEGGLPLPSRAPDFSIPRNADIPRRRIEEIVGEQTLSRLPALPTEELRGILASLADHEKTLSTRRKVVQEVMDTVQAEIVRRYVSGEADPTAALG
ncbi:MAG TPA: aerial mycelium formation protein [Actinomycetota bacterium]|nr:aerial mycelium formation protein [Actinomycetota bacterium]